MLIQFSFSQNPNFEHLLFPHYARSSAMGNSNIALYGDPGFALNNPASLSGIEGKNVSVNYINFLLDIYSSYASYATPYKFKFMQNEGYMAIHVFDINYGEIEGVDEYNVETGTNYSANDFALMLTWASFLDDNWDYGINMKFAHSSIASYSSSGLFFDFGIIYKIPRFYEFNLAFVVNNLGFFVDKYTESDQKIPLSMDVGFSKKLQHLPLNFSFMLEQLNRGNNSDYIELVDRWKMGLEFDVHPVVSLRAGLNRTVQKSLKVGNKAGFTGSTFGIGIHYNKFKMDISYWNWGDIGAPMQFGLSYIF